MCSRLMHWDLCRGLIINLCKAHWVCLMLLGLDMSALSAQQNLDA